MLALYCNLFFIVNINETTVNWIDLSM